MPITRSAKKAHRSSISKRAFNVRRKMNVISSVKSLKKLIAEGKQKEAREKVREVQKALGKAVKAHTLNKNTASRKLSRLAKLVKKI